MATLTPIKAGDLVPVIRRNNEGKIYVYKAANYKGHCSDHCDLYNGHCPGTCTKYEGGDNVVFKLQGPIYLFRYHELTLTPMQQPAYAVLMKNYEK
jgi:hypothetical protein